MRDHPEPPRIGEEQAAFHSQKFDELHALTPRQQADLANQVASDIVHNARSEDGLYGHFNAETGRKLSGAAQVDRLIEDALPAVRANTPDPADVHERMQLLRLDRRLLALTPGTGLRRARHDCQPCFCDTPRTLYLSWGMRGQ
jgi:hypothetical protein